MKWLGIHGTGSSAAILQHQLCMSSTTWDALKVAKLTILAAIDSPNNRAAPVFRPSIPFYQWALPIQVSGWFRFTLSRWPLLYVVDAVEYDRYPRCLRGSPSIFPPAYEWHIRRCSVFFARLSSNIQLHLVPPNENSRYPLALQSRRVYLRRAGFISPRGARSIHLRHCPRMGSTDQGGAAWTSFERRSTQVGEGPMVDPWGKRWQWPRPGSVGPSGGLWCVWIRCHADPAVIAHYYPDGPCLRPGWSSVARVNATYPSVRPREKDCVSTWRWA